jgi:adenosylmethionine-8-amino-7-oxononanoate aminotransferase
MVRPHGRFFSSTTTASSSPLAAAAAEEALALREKKGKVVAQEIEVTAQVEFPAFKA